MQVRFANGSQGRVALPDLVIFETFNGAAKV
jgi:hypothetical protein